MVEKDLIIYILPMKNFYNLFFSLNNLNEDENYLLDFNKKDDKESKDYKFLDEVLGEVLISPRKELVDSIIDLVRKGVI